jgi:hypothetical protein
MRGDAAISILDLCNITKLKSNLDKTVRRFISFCFSTVPSFLIDYSPASHPGSRKPGSTTTTPRPARSSKDLKSQE